jgi:peroxiredoxin
VSRQYDRIRAAGGEVLAVALAPPGSLVAFLDEQPLPFALVADPDREGYRAFGLGRTSWWTVFRPDVVWRYLRLIFRGTKPRRPGAGEDLLQLGGDFVLDAQGRIVFAHRSAEPTDRPPVEQLVRAVEQAAR